MAMWIYITIGLSLCILPSNVDSQVIKQQRVTYNEEGAVVATEDTSLAVKCYQYTWVGTYDPDKNDTQKTCTDVPGFLPSTDTDGVDVPRKPCWPPIVQTNPGADSQNGPNATEIEEKCREQSCSPTCILEGGQYCITYVEAKDDDRDYPPQYATAYCGSAVMLPNDPINLKNGGRKCYKTQRKDIVVEVCFCVGEKCNRLNFYKGGLVNP